MARYRYDRDLDCLVEVRDGSNYFEERGKAPAVISDLEPYRAVAADVACGGKRPVIAGRRQHREFLRRNGYTEVGNDIVPNRREELSRQDRFADIRRAMGE